MRTPPTVPSQPIVRYRRPWIWIAAVCAFLILLAVVNLRAFDRLDDHLQRVTKAHREVHELQSVYSSIAEIHSTLRGYVIIGDGTDLDSYSTQVAMLHRRLEKLRELVEDDPLEFSEYHTLSTTIESRLEFDTKVIETRRTIGREAASELLISGPGRHYIAETYRSLQQLIASQQETLHRSEVELRATMQQTRWIQSIALISVCGILALGIRQVLREVDRRQRQESALLGVNTELEQAKHRAESIAHASAVVGELRELLQSCRSIEEAFAILNQRLPRYFPDNPGAVSTLNNSRNLVEVHSQWGESMVASEFSPEDCWALRRGEIHLRDPDHPGPKCSHFVGSPVATCCLPLRVQGETIGVLHLVADQPWDIDERWSSKSMAEQIALALGNLRLLQSLRTQSVRDPLTGLFNRRYLEESLTRELDRAERHNTAVTVMMLDVDHFKRFNDSNGHDAGDLILTEIGVMLQNSSRGGDIACRYGGEEFTLILPDCPADSADKRAEEIRETMQRLEVSYHGQRFTELTMSIGVAVFPISGKTRESLIAAADKALYQAKSLGRNRVVMSGPPSIPEMVLPSDTAPG